MYQLAHIRACCRIYVVRLLCKESVWSSLEIAVLGNPHIHLFDHRRARALEPTQTPPPHTERVKTSTDVKYELYTTGTTSAELSDTLTTLNTLATAKYHG